jgi:histidyl-tRNA synthetase
MRLRNWLFDIWRQTAIEAGFEEYDACVLEHEELYVRKAGDEISQQLYHFTDKSDRQLSLRPEMTPSLARMILQQQKTLSFPLRWFSIPQCFRYERMTRGRKREHYQWNLDIIGQSETLAEAELLGTLWRAVQAMNLDHNDVRVFLNNRQILNAILTQLAVPEEQQAAVLVVMDKRDKLPADVFGNELGAQGLSTEQTTQLLEFLQLQDLEEVSAQLHDPTALEPLRQLLQHLDALGLREFVQFDISIVRGLSYYTGTVFEMNTPTKSFRAICGGGRYDSLLSAYGGQPIPAVGLGFGDVVILELLADLKKLPELQHPLDVMVFALDKEHDAAALGISHQLRQAGWRVKTEFGGMKMKKALQLAGALDVAHAVFLFPDELARGEVVLRNLAQREQRSIATVELPAALHSAERPL